MSAQVDFTSVLGESQDFQMLPAANLRVDDRYQRKLNQKHLRNIARNLSMKVFGVILVSQRDNGTFWIIDGQHRVAALELRGESKTLVPCHIYRGLTPQDEAIIFQMQTNRKAIVPIDRFESKMFAEDPDTMAIDRILRKYGYQVGNTAPGAVQAVAMIENVYERSGADRLDLIFDLFTAATDRNPEVIPTGLMIAGMNSFLARYEDQYDRNRLVRAIRNTGVGTITRSAAQIRDLIHENAGGACGRALLTAYNAKLSTGRLPDWESFTPQKLSAQTYRQRKASERKAESKA